MTRNENRRRKKLEAKRKKGNDRKREIGRRISTGSAGRLRVSSHWPVVEALMSDPESGRGMTTTALARRSPDGSQLAIAVFLVDQFCLGVKDAFARFETMSGWAELKSNLSSRQRLSSVAGEDVCRLVTEAVEYARSLGIAPHPDYREASLILGDLDPEASMTEFEFGNNGKPLYIAGPHDSSVRQRRILECLARTVGQGNYRFVLPIGDPGSDELEFESVENIAGPDADEFDV
ncbi:MAG: hypothetical protein KDA85_00600 [Planctomycetaceae bacterium]|nr:hypothetical protein [Planctomycetaceae bacterium]